MAPSCWSAGRCVDTGEITQYPVCPRVQWADPGPQHHRHHQHSITTLLTSPASWERESSTSDLSLIFLAELSSDLYHDHFRLRWILDITMIFSAFTPLSCYLHHHNNALALGYDPGYPYHTQRKLFKSIIHIFLR